MNSFAVLLGLCGGCYAAGGVIRWRGSWARNFSPWPKGQQDPKHLLDSPQFTGGGPVLSGRGGLWPRNTLEQSDSSTTNLSLLTRGLLGVIWRIPGSMACPLRPWRRWDAWLSGASAAERIQQALDRGPGVVAPLQL